MSYIPVKGTIFNRILLYISYRNGEKKSTHFYEFFKKNISTRFFEAKNSLFLLVYEYFR